MVDGILVLLDQVQQQMQMLSSGAILERSFARYGIHVVIDYEVLST